jgi:hypothetical protein
MLSETRPAVADLQLEPAPVVLRLSTGWMWRARTILTHSVSDLGGQLRRFGGRILGEERLATKVQLLLSEWRHFLE